MIGLSRTGLLALGAMIAWAGACGSTGGTTTTASTADTTSTASSTGAGAGGAGGATGSTGSTTTTGSGGAGACGPGEKLCDTACRLTTDPSVGCGATSCAPCLNEHGVTACIGGQCAPKCLLGWGDCDADPTNGCEHDILTDPLHCGSCLIACTVANGTAGCASAACTVASCDAGWADCDHDPLNGCEVSLDGGACP